MSSVENVICVDIPPSLRSTDACKSVREECFYLDETIETIETVDDVLKIHLDGPIEDDTRLRGDIDDVFDRLSKSFRRVRTQVLARVSGTGLFDQDPMPGLLGRGDILRHRPGVYTIQGDFLGLMRRIDDLMRRAAEYFNAVEQHYPTTVASRRLAEVGYIKSFPHHALLVSACRRTADSLRTLAESGSPDRSDLPLAPPGSVLAPTVCYRCMEAIADRTLEDLPRVYTGVASCHRNEEGVGGGFSRLNTFTMREIVFVGSPAFVDSGRMEAISQLQAMISDWGLAGEFVSATDPFFGDGGAAKRGFQSLMGKKYELRLHIPWSGESISVASFNMHDTTLTEPFGIQGESDELVASSCVGYGLERFALAICSQFGIEVDDWPETLRPIESSD